MHNMKSGKLIYITGRPNTFSLNDDRANSSRNDTQLNLVIFLIEFIWCQNSLKFCQEKKTE